MNQLVFKKKGQIDNFINWLERFKGDISKDSLIIEIDVFQKLFISKAYSDNKTFVRFSQISFDEAGFETESDVQPLGKDEKPRVLVGMLHRLTSYINVFKVFSTSDDVKLVIKYDTLDFDYCATSTEITSKTLKMRIPGDNIKVLEMTPISDDVFINKIYVAPDPVSVVVSPEMIKNIISISDIFASSIKNNNLMDFYLKKDNGKLCMFVKDEDSYDYNIGVVDNQECEEGITLTIRREMFLLATKTALDNTILTFSSSNPNRLLVTLEDQSTKTIISRSIR